MHSQLELYISWLFLFNSYNQVHTHENSHRIHQALNTHPSRPELNVLAMNHSEQLSRIGDFGVLIVIFKMLYLQAVS